MGIAGTTRPLNAIDFNLKDYGAKGNGSADDYQALVDLLAAMDDVDPSGNRGRRITIPYGIFAFSRVPSISRVVDIVGAGQGEDGAGTTILVDSGSFGILGNSQYSSPVGKESQWSTISNLRLRAAGKSAANMHGLVLRTRWRASNLIISGFSGNGVHIVSGDGNNVDGNTAWAQATHYYEGQWVTNGSPGTYFVALRSGVSAASGPGPVAASGTVNDGTVLWLRQSYMGNANNWYLDNVRVAECDGHGLYIEGDNVNAGNAKACDFSVNGGWGVYDKSFLGNRFSGCHFATNALGPYRNVDHGNQFSTFDDCYTEADQTGALLYSPGIAKGAIPAAGFLSSSTGLRIFGNSISPFTTQKTVNGVTQSVTRGNGLAGTNAIYSDLHTTSAIADDPGVRSFSHEGSGQWSLVERTNYSASMRLLSGDFPDVVQLTKARLPANNGAAGSVPAGNPGHGEFSYFGSPLLVAAGSNHFYVSDVIWNLNYATDGIKGWIVQARCGSGTPWVAANGPYREGATVTPTTPNGKVYRRHSSSTGYNTGATEPSSWPTTPGQLTAKDGDIYWECWGSTSSGLVAL